VPGVDATPASAPAGHGPGAVAPDAGATPPANSGPQVAFDADAIALERRGTERIERDTLIRQLRSPDPRARSAAFERLRPAGR